MGKIIEVHNVHKSFNNIPVLRGVNFSLEKGTSLVILGGSGAGKSVLLRHLIGLHHPDSGQIIIDGENLAELSRSGMYAVRRRFGFAFQEGALFDSLNVYENVAFPLKRHQRRWSRDQIRKRVEECLDLVGMPGTVDYMPSELSGGMRRRIGFARAIALQPEILLFDEPTSGLDPIMTSVINGVIVQLREELKATTITITHDLSSAREIALEIAMLFEGTMVEQGEKEQFLASGNPIVRQFLEGRPEGPATHSMLK